MDDQPHHPQERRDQDRSALRKVTVTYIAAPEPFIQHDVPRTEQVGTLKTAVLDAFHLTEGQSPNGTVTVYTLYHAKRPLENLSESLGDVAGHAEELHLKLVQEIRQG